MCTIFQNPRYMKDITDKVNNNFKSLFNGDGAFLGVALELLATFFKVDVGPMGDLSSKRLPCSGIQSEICE